MNVIIEGPPGSGKSTLIRKLLDNFPSSPVGFATTREPRDSQDRAEVYIHAFNDHDPQSRKQSRVGLCTPFGAEGFANVFNSVGVELLFNLPLQSIVVMDELGIMENNATDFRNAVMSVLDDDHLVIAAVKSKSTAFLDAVRHHPKSHVYQINPGNREELAAVILADIFRVAI